MSRKYLLAVKLLSFGEMKRQEAGKSDPLQLTAVEVSCLIDYS